MNKLVLTTLLFISTCGYCEKLKFSNNGEEVEIEGNAQIDFQTGDIVVETVGEHLIVETIPLDDIILGFYPSDYDVAIGESIIAYWTVANADNCSATVVDGVASNWGGAVSASNGNNSSGSITVNQMPATLRITCSNNSDSLIRTFQITEQEDGGQGGSPNITYLRVNGFSNSATVTPPGSATVTWASTDTTSCTASSNPTNADWNGSVATTGSKVISVSDNVELTLNCNSDVESFDIIYSNNSSCNSSVYPPGLTIDNRTYAELNDGFAFGENNDTDVLINIQNTDFVAISGFTFALQNETRSIDTVTPPGFNKALGTTVSISECPGDFSATAICSKVLESFRSMRFTTDPNSQDVLVDCVLDPTKTYYMNVINSHEPYSIAPYCEDSSDSACAIFYTETQR